METGNQVHVNRCRGHNQSDKEAHHNRTFVEAFLEVIGALHQIAKFLEFFILAHDGFLF